MGWQPIETAPKDGTLFLGLIQHYTGLIYDVCQWHEYPKTSPIGQAAARGEGPSGRFYSHYGLEVQDSCFEHRPSHWMPIPKAPE